MIATMGPVPQNVRLLPCVHAYRREEPSGYR
jgi:hypothetical protein